MNIFRAQFIEKVIPENQSISFEDYIVVDRNIHVTGRLSDEEIVANSAKLPDDDSDKDKVDNHETFLIPTSKDAMSAINTLSQYSESRDNVPDDLFSNLINMFHVFALAYLTIGFYDLTYYFSTVLRATSMSLYCNASVYTILLRMRGASTFAF